MGSQGSFPFMGPRATVRHTDPDTSHEAAAQFSEERLTEIQRAVYSYFLRVKRATDEELRYALGHKYPAESTLRKRRKELTEMGLLRDSGERKLNSNRRNMIVWELV